MTGTVVIVGGGPAGLLLAGELALAGVETVVIERRASPGTRSSGMAVHGRTLATLDLRGLGAPIRESMFPWPRTPFSMLWLDLSTVDELDHTFGFPQWRTETLLADWATERGAELRRETDLVSFTQDAAGVSVIVRGPGGEQEIRADYLVGCDGPDSAVRRAAGITLDAALPPYYGILGDVPLTDELEHLFDAGPRPGGMFGALPIEAGMLRLMSIEYDRAAPTGPATVAELAESVGRLNGTAPKIDEAFYLARFGGVTGVADRYREGRVLIAGDAAHPLFISGTQGLNAALQDVMNLGWKLAATLHGWAPAGLLDSYQAERRPAAERMVAHAEAVMALMHPLDRVGGLRSVMRELIAYPEVSRHLLRMPVPARYPLEPAEGAHPLTGTHLTDPELAGFLGSGRGVLFDFSGGWNAKAAEAAAACDGRVGLVPADPVPHLDVTLLLVRPDGHVAYAGDDVEELRAALVTWFGAPAPEGTVGTPADDADVSGLWRLTVGSPMGEQDVSVELAQVGAVLTGTLVNNGNQMTSPLTDGAVDGSTLTFKVKPKRLPTLSFTTTVRGTEMTGTVKAGMFGGYAVQGRRA